MVGGRLFLNDTSGTHIYFDKETAAGESEFYRYWLTPAAPLLKGYAKVESLSIAGLNDFVVTAPSQVYLPNLLCFSAGGASYLNTFHLSARYQVELAVADETGEGLFIYFDGVMTKLHNMNANEAVHLLLMFMHAVDGVNPEETQAPPFVTDMEGKIAETMTMEMTIPLTTQSLLRWKLLIVAGAMEYQASLEGTQI
ncbi:unnamed protein product [Eruca vesicaria subsp. sativa]|uniref:Uncharacterized protein n=1 Tax=Eruca vesicaria subsp. sativa TaxID=29727 RepID=A0ABC8M529_ERUVS|nr:unnamed protein product [Eruca vesicaria subsp. sativa]